MTPKKTEVADAQLYSSDQGKLRIVHQYIQKKIKLICLQR